MAEPEPDGLPLRAAFDAFTDPELRDAFYDAAREKVAAGAPPRILEELGWNPFQQGSGTPRSNYDLTRHRAFEDFFGRLRRGELRCWVREGSPVGPWREVPAEAWYRLMVAEWLPGTLTTTYGTAKLISLGRPGDGIRVSDVPSSSPSTTDVIGYCARVTAGQSASTTQGAASASLLEPSTGPANTESANDAFAARRRAYSPRRLREWYAGYVQACTAAGKVPSREDDLVAARAEFDLDLPREALRVVRRQLAPPEWRRGGPRKTWQEKPGGQVAKLDCQVKPS